MTRPEIIEMLEGKYKHFADYMISQNEKEFLFRLKTNDPPVSNLTAL